MKMVIIWVFMLLVMMESNHIISAFSTTSRHGRNIVGTSYCTKKYNENNNKVLATATFGTTVTTTTTNNGISKMFMAKNDKFFTNERREKLGLDDQDDEYDLDVALNQNTDPLITKLIAGSLILVVMALLVAGIVVPSITDYGEGVCSPIQNGGRC
mmetsp:Transcript_17652/g.17086  ORF Transcript_17652/g.17086 Transcript_17652/m.17086 type:complete len:156 (-) Transcript_17652:11-478(-)